MLFLFQGCLGLSFFKNWILWQYTSMINRTILKHLQEALAVFPVVYLKVLIL